MNELRSVPIEAVSPCPIQPRVNVSVDLVSALAASMREGRHEPLIEVERIPGESSRYQIVCGEQRWRAANQAGLRELLVRVHPPLGYLERLQKQYEENRLRADLDPIEDAHTILLDHTVRSALAAERLLERAQVPFEALETMRITHREQIAEQLGRLRALLLEHRLHTVRSADGSLSLAPLVPWSETERALHISESQRKAKVGILRLPPELQESVRELPAEHAVQISRLRDPSLQSELIDRARSLTHRQVQAAVDRLRAEPALTVDQALASRASTGSVELEDRIEALADLCRQLLRIVRNLRTAEEHERATARALLGDVRRELDAFCAEAAP